jgi:glucose-1-phosphate thymidylyltransferase
MIYGLIPVGGKGLRLSLPYSKEMLPQKNYDFFNPLINHIVEKMEMSGAEKIYMIHGTNYKTDITQHFVDAKYNHVLQTKTGFANVIGDFLNALPELKDDDKVLFGLPDSVFDGNPFVEMLMQKNIVCGLFKTDKNTKVDRLSNDGKFEVKSSKNENNKDWFWGVLKFDGKDIKRIVFDDRMLEKHIEIGHILNEYDLNYIKGHTYLDLGTWSNYNRYLSNSHNFSNTEIEKKYDASDVNESDFVHFFQDYTNSIYKNISSKDYYFTNGNPNIEFIRYREGDVLQNEVDSDITIKNFKNSQLNRFELTIPLDTNKTNDVLHFISLMNTKFEFDVVKQCHIFDTENYSAVMYKFVIDNKTTKIIEIELKVSDFNLITDLETLMNTNLKNFDSTKIIKKSKFQMIKEQLNDASH